MDGDETNVSGPHTPRIPLETILWRARCIVKALQRKSINYFNKNQSLQIERKFIRFIINAEIH